jgi:hypothetical protein
MLFLRQGIGEGFLKLLNIERSTSNVDMAAKRHKKHKNKISGLLISMGYNE